MVSSIIGHRAVGLRNGVRCHRAIAANDDVGDVVTDGVEAVALLFESRRRGLLPLSGLCSCGTSFDYRVS